MKQEVYRFALSALLYWLCTIGTDAFLVMPSEVIHLTVFLLPILGLMWGPVAAAGVYAGALIAASGFGNLTPGGGLDGWVLVHEGWVFLAGWLPGFLWYRWRIPKEEPAFPFQTSTLVKFLVILMVTFAVTSMFRSMTATVAELDATAGWLGTGLSARIGNYILACFVNDFFVTVFFDIVLFFFLVSMNFAFYHPAGCSEAQLRSAGKHSELNARRTWAAALTFYATFPAGFAYLELYQIYGMDNMRTWLHFIVECVAMMDVVFVLMIYLLLHYRRSIMMEVAFLVTIAVFLSASVLGWGISVAMVGMVSSHAEDNMREMSIICRERLDRTFFCTRQAVNGMAQQAINNIESYQRLTEDADYREAYYATLVQSFSGIAMSTDGCLAYYLRLDPSIAGPTGGFSMQREDVRWEGALAPFKQRVPIDISKYSPDDVKNVGWYYIPIRNHHATWIEPYVDPTAQEYVISYVYPLQVEGHDVGIIGIDIDFNFIIQELRRLSIYDYGYVYVMNRNGRVLYHRDQPQGSLFQPNPEYQEMEIYLTNGMWLGIATPLSKVHEERNRVMMHLIAAILVVAMLVSLGSIALASRAIRPLAGMTEAAKRIASGDLNVEISYESGNELGLLVRSIREMAAKLEGYVYRDKLTGLRNAAAYMSKGTELDERRKREKELQYGVIIFDANFLKKVNDQYGHESGNELIRHASQVICRVFAHSPVYRIGGDEFAAVLERQDYERREELLRRFDEQAAAERFEVAGGTMLVVSVARGLGVYEPGMDFAAVAKAADAAMYEHKSVLKAALGEDVR